MNSMAIDVIGELGYYAAAAVMTRRSTSETNRHAREYESPPPDGQQQKQQPAMNRTMPNSTNQTPAAANTGAAVKPTD